MMSDMITWLCACMRMWKSAKNDNSIHESDWQERTLLYRYISRETEEKIENFANKKKHVLSHTCECRRKHIYHWYVKTVIHSLQTYFSGISYVNKIIEE
jgi:hypothetical protein